MIAIEPISLTLAGLIAITLCFVVPWRRAVVFCLYCILFETLVRRYILNSGYVFLAKDLLLLRAYVGWATEHRTSAPRGAMWLPPALPLAALATWTFAQVFNPLLPDPLTGIFGLRSWFLYVPLLFVVPHCFPDREHVYRFLRTYLYAAVPICLLGVAQQVAGKDSWISHTYYDEFASPDISVGGYYTALRSPSTFASAAGFADFTFFVLLLSTAATQSEAVFGRKRWLSIAVFTSGVLGVVSQGSTFGGITVAVLVPALLFLGGTASSRIHLRPLFVLAGLGAGIAWAFAVVPEFMKAGTLRATLAVSDTTYAGRRARMTFTDPIETALKYPFGRGVGVATRGVQHLQGLGGRQSDGEGVEGGYAMVVWELGIPGLVLFLLVLASLLHWSTKLLYRLRDPGAQWLCAAVLSMNIGLGCIMVFTQKLDHFGFAIPFWFFNGLLFAMQRFDVSPYVPSHFKCVRLWKDAR